jgi:hypothetical protein
MLDAAVQTDLLDGWIVTSWYLACLRGGDHEETLDGDGGVETMIAKDLRPPRAFFAFFPLRITWVGHFLKVLILFCQFSKLRSPARAGGGW